jgi:dienelactone hydrolase
MWSSLFALALLAAPGIASACEPVSIKWNGDYPHNNEKVWSKDYDFGWSKNFLNGTPQENFKVQREGSLRASICNSGSGKRPFVILMHGCGGMDANARRWSQEYANYFNGKGYGVLILDSFTTRGVRETCGKPDGHWARRRSEDAYSAAEYLSKTDYADMEKVHLVGRSNGGSATVMAMEDVMAKYHPHKFKMGFAMVPGCGGKITANFYAPLVILAAGQDDANSPEKCKALAQHSRATGHPLVKTVVYRTALHGYMDNVPTHIFHGWRMGYDAFAAEDSVRLMIEFMAKGPSITQSGVEFR